LDLAPTVEAASFNNGRSRLPRWSAAAFASGCDLAPQGHRYCSRRGASV